MTPEMVGPRKTVFHRDLGADDRGGCSIDPRRRVEQLDLRRVREQELDLVLDLGDQPLQHGEVVQPALE